MIESNLLPIEKHCSDFRCWGPPKELQPITMWYRNTARETMYREQPEPWFRIDMMIAYFLFLVVGATQFLVIDR